MSVLSSEKARVPEKERLRGIMPETEATGKGTDWE